VPAHPRQMKPLVALGLVAVALLVPARSAQAAVNPFAQASLRAFLAHRRGNVSAVVYDISDHLTYLYRSHIGEQTASIMKVDILATLLHERQRSGLGLSPAQQSLARGMIEESDNDDAQKLWDEEGGSTAVGAFDHEAGMDETTPDAAGYWGLSWTTASDQLRLLRRVMLRNRLLDFSSRAYEYELMRHVVASQRWGVSAGVGRHATVALKNGWLKLHPVDWQVNSIGKVAGSRHRYLIAVLTSGQPTEGYGIATIERVSAATWRALGRRR
jgi:Beta-lactamase enzyme family